MSLELAIVGGLIGAAGVLLFLSSLLDKQTYSYLITVFRFTALFFILNAIADASGFLRIAYTATSNTTYLGMANSMDTIYTVYLLVLEFTVFYMFLILFWNIITKLYMRYLGDKKPVENYLE